MADNYVETLVETMYQQIAVICNLNIQFVTSNVSESIRAKIDSDLGHWVSASCIPCGWIILTVHHAWLKLSPVCVEANTLNHLSAAKIKNGFCDSIKVMATF